MTAPDPLLAAHLRRHAPKLHRIACGFGRERDADDILQTLYTSWWRRMRDEPGWLPPEDVAELFVCVRHAVLDVLGKEKRLQARIENAPQPAPPTTTAEDTLFAFDRLQWILDRLPAGLSEVLQAALSSGRQSDAAVAAELGLSAATFTTRLFKARRAAEELALFYELLPLDRASLLADLRYSGKTRAQVARDWGLSVDELNVRASEASDVIDRERRAS
jgi:DNA-directed RNA polymerase specialized sigma24 family protein